ncbi:hypothetical protein GKQ77_13550 [Streptomyces sp. BG9H]|uniref:Uncharacterized protein n=1 Tax=Streptomyces anatolicus TaxID=2675858 RepID=A0ABS6YME1_9ACTN|nr:hypothetical protein [Streptomyces anatolicus]MBW5422578.1 hypothetical protein [Streptomyces anatolicus]
MSRRVLLAVGVVMACLPATAVAATAEPTPPQLEEKEVPVPVVNGSFSQPQVKRTSTTSWEQIYGSTETKPWYWGASEANTAAGVIVAAGADRAGRSDNKQAVRVDALLTADGTDLEKDKHLKTRLWDVRKGSRVTVRFDYSPTIDGACPATPAGQDPQRKKLRLQMRIDRKVAWDKPVDEPAYVAKEAAGKKTDVGRANWQTVTHVFTAENDHPEVAFALPDVRISEKNTTAVGVACHPMIAAVSARQRPIQVDKSRRKTELPPAKSFQGNDPSASAVEALEKCGADTGGNCKFTLNQRYSYGYYDRPRPVGEVYENCTFGENSASAALRDKRKVVYRERSFDSATQAANTQFLDSGSHAGLTGDDLSHDVSHAAPSKESGVTADTNQATAGKAAVHFAAAYEKVRDQPWQWSRAAEREIDVVTPKNHASWVEVSAARERVDGHYTVTSKATTSASTEEPVVHRQFITYDGPSRITSDRVFQRHGTLSPTEIERCKTHRPLPYTPAEEPVVPYDPKDTDVEDESLTPGTAVGNRNVPPAKK